MCVCVCVESVKMIAGEGMPRYRNPTQKGNLIVKFEIDFPNKNFLSEAEMKVGIC